MKYPANYLTDLQQHTPEWLVERIGCITSSRVDEAVRKLKSGKYSADREKYKMEKLEEVLTGRAAEHYVSMAMDFGTEHEPVARGVYEMTRREEVETIGYIRHPRIPRSGASPDGLVGDEGLVEIKVPNTTTHLSYVLAEVVPDDYKSQMMWQMACSGRQWCDFVSYDPRLHEDFNLFVVRFYRDDKAIAEMEREVVKFIAELDELAKKLQKHSTLKSKLEDSIRAAGPGPEKAEIPSFQ